MSFSKEYVLFVCILLFILSMVDSTQNYKYHIRSETYMAEW